MSFREKIDKILKDNKLGINTPTALEKHLKVGVGSINAHYRAGTVPGLKILKKIAELEGLNKSWFETGRGEAFSYFGEKHTLVNKDETPTSYPDMLANMQRLIESQEREIKRLTKDLEECLKRKATA